MGAEGLEILRFNPKQSTAKVYHSFQEGFLLVSLEPTKPASFRCTPNSYLIYQNSPEKIIRIRGGNLQVAGDFKKLVYLKVLKLGPEGTKGWAVQAKKRSDQLQASPSLLVAAAMKDHKTQCWQQPVWVDTQGFKETPVPVIAANLCKKRWCSELTFTKTGELKFWAALEPKKRHLAVFDGLNLLDTLKTSGSFTKPTLNMEPVPRKNLLAGKPLDTAQIALVGGRRLVFKAEKNQMVMILLRSKPDVKKAATRLSESKALLSSGQPQAAFEQAQLASWLNPKNFSAKYQQLVSLAGFASPGTLFKHLDEDFTKWERKKACGQIHLDKSFQRLKTKKAFLDKFNQACPTAFAPVF